MSFKPTRREALAGLGAVAAAPLASGPIANAAASPADVWRTNGGIYLGRTVLGGTDSERPLVDQQRRPSRGPEYRYRTTWEDGGGNHLYAGEGHLVTVAPPGSGKTRKIVLPNLFALFDWSQVVIDIKGELTAHTAVFRAQKKGHRVVVIDPFRVMEKNYPRLFAKHPDILRSQGYNLFRAFNPHSDEFVDEAKYLAEALISTEGTKEVHFPQGAQTLTKGLSMVLRVDKPGQSDSLVAFRNYLGMSPDQMAKFIAEDIKRFGEKWPAIAASLGEFANYNAEDREIAGIRRTAKIQTDWLDSPLMRADLQKGGDNFTFASLKKTPTTVYLILPPKRLRSHHIWLKLIVTAALMPLLDTVEKSPVPVLFALDEFAALGHMGIIEDNIAQMRGFGVKLHTIWQSVNQAKRIYPESWEDFFGTTAGAQVVFGPRDSATREYFSQLSGERLYQHHMHSKSASRSTSFGMGQGGNFANNIMHNLTNDNTSVSDSMNEHLQQERVIKPYELAALDADEAVIFAPRGILYRAICPQPEYLPHVGDAIRAARREIDGVT
jgi:type IV secretion system protein VirD4